MKLNALAMSVVAMLTLAVGCGVADGNVTQGEQVTAQGSTCAMGQHLCPTCDGKSTYCAVMCGDCAVPIAAPTVEAEGLTCKTGQRLCPTCDGTGTYCATRCFECAPQVVANPDPSVSAMGSTSCPPRQFLCQRCDGSYQCAPECAPCL
ncbi:hypothetical protein [Corallococcus caeni]|uniref:Uncharacterized protein n=1 Tax=Corallococcus caeni TaxID=3082388 RepID=A0ABQ6R597_9BACT|nr:hypothetical protein ASNO1_77340 [Corallococcus sp. NO1]